MAKEWRVPAGAAIHACAAEWLKLVESRRHLRASTTHLWTVEAIFPFPETCRSFTTFERLDRTRVGVERYADVGCARNFCEDCVRDDYGSR
jgi:hypothetical protein